MSKFYKFFLTCFKTVGKIIFEGFKYCPSWKAPFQLSGTFLSFFIWSVSCSLFFSDTLLAIKMYELSPILTSVYLYCPKNSTTDSRKPSITPKWLVVETCPIPRWIAFLMIYRLVYNRRSHFNELILAWSVYWQLISVLSTNF